MIKVIFHKFTLADVDDIDIYVAQPIHEWQQTDKGKWVMENATDLTYYTHPDVHTFGHNVVIKGKLEEKKATEYYLRWK